MIYEIESVANLITHLMKLSNSGIEQSKLNIFKSVLISILTDRYSRSVWKPNDPLFESDSRKIKIERWLPLRVQVAYQTANICEFVFRNALPKVLIISPNPGSVTFQIGENGPECQLYHKDGPCMAWDATEDYLNIAEEIYSKTNSINYAKLAYHYIEFKQRYQPWDGRKLCMDMHPITIDGTESKAFLNEDLPDYIDTPDVILENENRHAFDFTSFCKWYKKGIDIDIYATKLDCIHEFLNHLNGEDVSDYFSTHYAYRENKTFYDHLFLERSHSHHSNAYWIEQGYSHDNRRECNRHNHRPTY